MKKENDVEPEKKNEDKHHFDVKKSKEYKALIDERDKLEIDLKRAKQGEKDAVELAKNFKKDMDRIKERFKEKEDQVTSEISIETAKKLLDIQDNFEKSFNLISDEKLIAGFKMIYQKVENAINSLGVYKTEVKPGEDFDENTMNAIFAEPAGENKDNTVSKVFAPGYIHKTTNKIIRYAQVSIYKE